MTEQVEALGMCTRPGLVLLVLFASLAAGLALAEPASADPSTSYVQIPVTGADVQRAAAQKYWFDCCRRPCWDFEVAIPIWIPGVTGTAADGDISVGPVEDFDDFFDSMADLRYAFVGAVTLRHKRWSLGIDAFGAAISQGVSFKLIDGATVEGEMGAIIGRAQLAYEFDRRPLRLFGCPACLIGRAYVGTRYYYASIAAALPGGRGLDASESWFDPLVGLEAILYWRRWSFEVKGDLGGFSVGSDMSYWLSGVLEYRFSRMFSLLGGYSMLKIDFEEGSGVSRFVWDVTLHGPMLGLRFRF